MAGDFVPYDLAAQAGDANWSVVCRVISVAFFENGTDSGVSPALGTVAWSRDLWSRLLRVGAMVFVVSFRSLALRSSGLVAFCG